MAQEGKEKQQHRGEAATVNFFGSLKVGSFLPLFFLILTVAGDLARAPEENKWTGVLQSPPAARPA